MNKVCVGVSVGADGRASGHVCSVQVGVESQRGIQEPGGGKRNSRRGPLGAVRISDSQEYEIATEKAATFLGRSRVQSRQLYVHRCVGWLTCWP